MLAVVILSAGLAPQAPASRRAVLSSAAAAASTLVPLAARSFDLPILEDYENPIERAKYAAMKNPGEGKQQSSIFYAITVNDLPSIKAMADNGWELPKLQDTAGKTALHRAAQVGNVGASEILLKAGCNINAATRWSETPLHMAVRNGRLSVVKLLVESGAKLDVETVGGDTALLLAKKYKKADVEAYLAGL